MFFHNSTEHAMRYMFFLFTTIFATTLLSCLPEEKNTCSTSPPYKSQFHYTVDATETTPSGIRVDRSGQAYPTLSMIDRLVDDTEQCLIRKYGNPPVLPEDVMKSYNCASSTFSFPFPRECITVKIPNDWMISQDEQQELLPFSAPSAGCIQKNPTHEEQDGCFWRAGLQCSNTIVSTPSMYVFKDPLIRATMHCNNPWGVNIFQDGSSQNLAENLPNKLRLSECASPATSNVSPRSPLTGKQKPEGFLGYDIDPTKTECGY